MAAKARGLASARGEFKIPLNLPLRKGEERRWIAFSSPCLYTALTRSAVLAPAHGYLEKDNVV